MCLFSLGWLLLVGDAQGPVVAVVVPIQLLLLAAAASAAEETDIQGPKNIQDLEVCTTRIYYYIYV